MKNIRKISVFLLRAAGVCALCAALLAGWYLLENREVTREAKFLFAGTKEDADCSILLSGDTCVVIDTGEEEDAPHILELLKDNKVEKINCLILTHPDKDHIGGASYLLDQIPVVQVLRLILNVKNRFIRSCLPDLRRNASRWKRCPETACLPMGIWISVSFLRRSSIIINPMITLWPCW